MVSFFILHYIYNMCRLQKYIFFLKLQRKKVIFFEQKRKKLIFYVEKHIYNIKINNISPSYPLLIFKGNKSDIVYSNGHIYNGI